MEGESTSCRRLNFEGNEDSRECDFANIDEGLNIEIDLEELDIPQMGMEFETEQDAYEFYLEYAKKVGFGVRRGKTHNDKWGQLLDRVFCCCAQGKRGKDKRDLYVKESRGETRFGCEAKMKISNRKKGKLTVVQFVKEHNHYLASPHKTHLYRSHRNITPKVLQNMRYKELMKLNVQLVTKAAERDDTYNVVKDAMMSLCKMVDDKLQVNESNVQQSKVTQESDYGQGNSTGVKGIKTKKKTVSGKRLKGGLEKISRKRRAAWKTNQASTMGVDQTISSMAIVQCDRSNHQPINSMPTVGSSVDSLSMTETQFPPFLASQLSQVHQPSYIGRS